MDDGGVPRGEERGSGVRFAGRVGAVCWSGVFYVLLVLYSLAGIPLLSLYVACRAAFTSRRQGLRLFRRAIWWYGRVIVHVLPRPYVCVRYEGYRPPPDAGGMLVVCNHRSAVDPFLMAALPLPEIVQVVNKWPMRLPVWGFMARHAGYLSIREMPVEAFLARASELLAQGVAIVSFPEGTRAQGREVGPFHGTTFRLCLQQKVPILPVCVSGNERVLPRGARILRAGCITLRALPPLAWEQYRDLSPFQLKNFVRQAIVRELAAMEAVP